MNQSLSTLLGAEMRRAVDPAIVSFARILAARAGGSTVAVLFYGSALRDGARDGVLDFYVLTDRASDWPGSWLSACANRILPPNVGYLRDQVDGVELRAKYAVLTLTQFRRAVAIKGLDSTLWARFSQPCACVHVRSDADFAEVCEAVRSAVVTAACWAAWLGPIRAESASFWRNLYLQTYAAELRVERKSRGADLLAHNAERFARLLPLAWNESGITFEDSSGQLAPALDPATRTAAQRKWRQRRLWGRMLNLARLLKAALTFANAIDYVAWKVERHSGYRIEPTNFQRRHPLLAAPGLYWRLRRQGVLR